MTLLKILWIAGQIQNTSMLSWLKDFFTAGVWCRIFNYSRITQKTSHISKESAFEFCTFLKKQNKIKKTKQNKAELSFCCGHKYFAKLHYLIKKFNQKEIVWLNI